MPEVVEMPLRLPPAFPGLPNIDPPGGDPVPQASGSRANIRGPVVAVQVEEPCHLVEITVGAAWKDQSGALCRTEYTLPVPEDASSFEIRDIVREGQQLLRKTALYGHRNCMP